MRTAGGATAGQLAFVRGFTRYQWLVFLVVWAGWSLDATDFGLFSLVLRPALTELLGGQPTIAEIGRVGGILSTIGLLGWSLGGFLFGIVADYIGRIRTLALSILIYSVFTGLQGLALSPVDLGIYRFFAGVGTGAEIIVGIPLVAEAFAEIHRAKILGVMMTGGAMGSIIGGQVYALIGGYGWRYVFFVGIAPALLLLLIRRGMVEPEHFRAVRERRLALAATGRTATAEDREFLRFVPLQLLNKELRFNTLVGLLFVLGTLLAIWTTVIWLPTIQSLMLEKEGIKGAAAAPIIGRNMMLWGIGGIFGYASFGFIADLIGRRPTVALYNFGTPRPRADTIPGRRQHGALSLSAPPLRVRCARRVFGSRRLHSRALPDPCARHGGFVLQRRRPRHHQLRSARGGSVGCPVRRQLQQAGRDHDLLCAPEHLRDASRPRDPR
jgi:MFS family permease